MGQPQPDTAALFARMDTKARQVIERRFRARLHSAQSTESQQAAWDVYQNTTIKLVEALQGGAEIGDPEGYAATIARHRCYDYWRDHSPDWYELKGRLYRFLGKQPDWGRWKTDELRGWICGPRNYETNPTAEGSKVAALLEKPRRIAAGYLPKIEIFQRLEASDWDRLLRGVFEFLGGPVRLDELVSICGVLFGVKGARELAFDDLSPDPEDGRAWEPPGEPPATLDKIILREQIAALWAEVKTMPKRWLQPFLLNPPAMKGGQSKRPRVRGGSADPAKPERGEIEVFTALGCTTIAEISSLIGFSDRQYSVLWAGLAIETPLETLPDSTMRFGVIWSLLPLEDDLIAQVMGLESGQKVINLRTVAKNHLTKVLTTNMAARTPPGKGERSVTI